MRSDSLQKPSLTDGRVALALTLLAVAVRLPGLSASFYGDEGFSLLRDSDAWITPTEDRFRPIFFTLLHLWKVLGFHGEAGLRLLPLLFGVLQVPLAFGLARRLGGSSAGAVVGVLMALNPMLVEFSQELRMYSLVPFIALAQAWAFAVAAERAEQGGEVPWKAWAGFVAAGVAGVYTHFHYWFFIVGFAAAALARRREVPLLQSLGALAAIGLLYLPDVPNLQRFAREAADQPHLRGTDLPSALPKLVSAICFGFNYFVLPRLGIERAVRGEVLETNAGLVALLAVPAALVAWGLVRQHVRRPWPALIRTGHELFTVPVVVSFAAVLATGKDFIHPKYMVFSAPFFLFFVAAGFLAIPLRPARYAAAAAGLLVCAVSILHFNEPWQYGRRESWREAAEYLRTRVDGDSVVLLLGQEKAPKRLVASPSPRSVWEYYAGDLFPWVRLLPVPDGARTADDAAPFVLHATAGKHRVFYVWSEIMANVYDPRDSVIAAARAKFGEESRTQFNPRLAVYSWIMK